MADRAATGKMFRAGGGKRETRDRDPGAAVKIPVGAGHAEVSRNH
ncbi:hypothetical protein [Hoyosella subflava]|uniref:Uncharacterized protein n=1 Tax=Hoyosella subflava (strain DSM 45089 / JCM 17490 / NBRC 109087 / DQS3-9A1) TaxID=443218 RepID=F6EMG1_HOYSD|nr:hypothetical protein AS9A_1872 [Hoyosella subflava DQS3-9A1]